MAIATLVARPARARLNSLLIPMGLRALAAALLDWQVESGRALAVPICLKLRDVLGEGPGDQDAVEEVDETDVSAEEGGDAAVPGGRPEYVSRTARIRAAIAGHLDDGDPRRAHAAAPGNGADDRDRQRGLFDLDTRRPDEPEPAPEFADPVPFHIRAGHVWFLGPTARLDAKQAREAVSSSDESATLYVRLLLLKELAEQGAIEGTDAILCPGFGSKVYFSTRSDAARTPSVLTLAEVDFETREKAGAVHLRTIIRSKAFRRRAARRPSDAGRSTPAGTQQLMAAGEDATVTLVRLNPAHYMEADGRRYRMAGITLHRGLMRRSRLYFLNVASEFASAVMRRADIAAEPEVFAATHVVKGGFVGVEALACLDQTLSLVVPDAAGPVGTDGDAQAASAAAARLSAWDAYFGDYQVARRRAPFVPPVAEARPLGAFIAGDDATERDTTNYLFFNRSFLDRSGSDSGADEADDDETIDGPEDIDGERESTVRVWPRGTGADPNVWRETSAAFAYELLSAGTHEADVYTQAKFDSVMNRPRVERVLQGIDAHLSDLASLPPLSDSLCDPPAARSLRTIVKRSVLEVSLKEALVRQKLIPLFGVREEDIGLAPYTTVTLVATRRLAVTRGGRATRMRSLVSVVEAEILPGVADPSLVTLRVTDHQRTPWSRSEIAALPLCERFPFLQGPDNGPIRDDQFWVVGSDGARLAAWRGEYVPKILLNDRYIGIEAALREQDRNFTAGEGMEARKTYSKSASTNLLPYYMSMLELPERGEAPALKIALQDCGPYLRVFVPPAGGLDGPGSNSFSCMRDVMVYAADGEPLPSGLVDHPLARLYLHTLTAGVLVAGGNSKMSLLEKLARIALEN